MAWSSVPTFVSGNVFTAAQANILGGNLNETAPGLAAFTGEYFVATGANAIAGRRVFGDSNNTVTTTTSGTYVTTAMPTVTETTGGTALVFLFAYLSLSVNSSQGFYAYQVSGTTTVAANDQRALSIGRSASDFAFTASAVILESGLTPGTNNVFTAAARTTGGTLTVDTRRIAVMPF